MIHASARWTAVIALAVGCGDGGKTTAGDVRAEADIGGGAPACDPDDGGISLLPGFCAAVVADELGKARHLAVTPSGDVYVAMSQYQDSPLAFGLVALRDGEDADAMAEEIHTVHEGAGSGVAWKDGKLYFGLDDRILRFDAPDGTLLTEGAPFEVVVSGLPADGDHTSKTFALDDDGNLFVNIGSASNSCQVDNRVAASLGMDPCPELEVRAGLWRFDASGTDLTQDDGERYATGIRNGVAVAIHPDTGEVVVVQQGRDSLHTHWPGLYSHWEELSLPSEELFVIREGADYGWPYCFFNPAIGKVLAPEYGGDGLELGRCADTPPPDATFPSHWSPLAIAFVGGSQFPESLRGGALISWHGSWHGTEAVGPLPGYQVAWIPWTDAGPSSEMLRFAWDFVTEDERPLPEAARHRPMGLAQGPDGSLYISDDQGGRIYRVWWTGDR